MKVKEILGIKWHSSEKDVWKPRTGIECIDKHVHIEIYPPKYLSEMVYLYMDLAQDTREFSDFVYSEYSALSELLNPSGYYNTFEQAATCVNDLIKNLESRLINHYDRAEKKLKEEFRKRQITLQSDKEEQLSKVRKLFEGNKK